MAENRKKWLVYTLAVAGVAIAGFAMISTVEYYLVVKNGAPIERSGKVNLEPGSKIPLGSSLTATVTFKCPWNRWPVSADAIAGKGAQLVGKPAIECGEIGWGYCNWRVCAAMQPFQNGKITSGTMVVTFNDVGGAVDRKISVQIPDFTVKSLTVSNPDNLALATKIKLVRKSNHQMWLLISGVVLLIMIIAVVLWIRKRRRNVAVIIPPWTIALAEIRELSQNLKKGLISSEFCITKLTDTVRFYIEKQFRLHPRTQTTKEFMTDLERPGSPLADEHRSFLKEFLTAADLVKFANCPADSTLIDHTIEKAEQLVDSTKEISEQ